MGKERDLWVVSGETGEYSDHVEWIVAVYLDQDMAERHKAAAQARANEIVAYRHSDEYYESYEYDDAPKMYSRFDPRLVDRSIYDEIKYHVHKETLYFHFDQFLEEVPEGPPYRPGQWPWNG